jgi:hypothetical protein
MYMLRSLLRPGKILVLHTLLACRYVDACMLLSLLLQSLLHLANLEHLFRLASAVEKRLPGVHFDKDTAQAPHVW